MRNDIIKPLAEMMGSSQIRPAISDHPFGSLAKALAGNSFQPSRPTGLFGLNLSSPTKRAEPEMIRWQGESGNWYYHSIFSIDEIPAYKEANYIFVQRDYTGKRRALYIGQSGVFSDRLSQHEKFSPAVRMGANEVHIHLSAKNRHERFQVETDLRNGHNPPLNEQNVEPLGDWFSNLLNRY